MISPALAAFRRDAIRDHAPALSPFGIGPALLGARTSYDFRLRTMDFHDHRRQERRVFIGGWALRVFCHAKSAQSIGEEKAPPGEDAMTVAVPDVKWREWEFSMIAGSLI
jgi:hypothetical protein